MLFRIGNKLCLHFTNTTNHERLFEDYQVENGILSTPVRIINKRGAEIIRGGPDSLCGVFIPLAVEPFIRSREVYRINGKTVIHCGNTLAPEKVAERLFLNSPIFSQPLGEEITGTPGNSAVELLWRGYTGVYLETGRTYTGIEKPADIQGLPVMSLG